MLRLYADEAKHVAGTGENEVGLLDVNASTTDITKADVPTSATPTGQLAKFAVVVVALVVGFLYQLYPGIVELSIAVVFGALLGLLNTPQHIAMATRAAVAHASGLEPDGWWNSRYTRDMGSIVLTTATTLAVGLAAMMVDYRLWRRWPELSMPWARFAYSTSWRSFLAPPGDCGYPFDSIAVAVMSTALFAQILISILLVLWYRSLPPHPFTQDKGSEQR